MLRSRLLDRILVALVAVSLPIAAWAQSPSPTDAQPGPRTPLAFVPADAAFVVRLAKPSESLDRFRAFLRASGIVRRGQRDPVDGFGTLIGDPELAWVDKDEDCWIVGLAAEGKPLSFVFIVPTDRASTAKRALEAAVGREQVRHRESWMVYSTSPDAVRRTNDAAEGRAPTLDASLSPSEKALLLDGDVVIRVDSAILLEQFRSTGKPLADAAMGRLGLPDEAADHFETVAADFEHLAESVPAIVIALRVGPAGVGVELLATFAESGGSRSNQPQPLSSFDELPRLAEDQLVYFGASGLTGPAAKAAFAKYVDGLPRRLVLRKRLAALSEELAGIEIGDVLGSVGLGRTEGGALRVVKIVAAGPTDKVRAVVRREYGDVAFDLAGTAQQVEIERDAYRMLGVTGDALRVSVRRDSPYRDWIDALYGRSGLEGHVAIDDGRIVQVLGGGDEFGALVHRRMANRAGPLGNGDLIAMRRKLPEKVHVLAFVDLPSTIIGLVRVGLRGGAIRAAVDPTSLDEFDRERSYCGASFGLEPTGARVAVFVPTDQITRTRSAFEFLSSRFRLPGS